MIRHTEDEAIEATAAAWLAERDDGFDAEREAEFRRWHDTDVRHAHAVARLDAAWTQLQALRSFRPEAAMHPDRNLLRAPVRRPRSFAAAGWAAAAAAVILTLAWLGAGVFPRSAPWQVHGTTVNGYERVTLADNSVVELNGDSEIRVRYTPEGRRVQLVRGEAHFTVAKDPARPFAVEAGSVAVRAVGTAFNVRLAARDVEVLVTEGRVTVAPRQGGKDAPLAITPASAQAPALRAEMAANERLVVPLAPPPVTVSVVAPVVERLPAEVVREALAWQGPRLVFVDTPLADAVAQFNRRNPVRLELADRELGELPIGGSFRADSVEAFVRLLVSGGEVVSEQPAADRIVLRKVK